MLPMWKKIYDVNKKLQCERKCRCDRKLPMWKKISYVNGNFRIALLGKLAGSGRVQKLGSKTGNVSMWEKIFNLKENLLYNVKENCWCERKFPNWLIDFRKHIFTPKTPIHGCFPEIKTSCTYTTYTIGIRWMCLFVWDVFMPPWHCTVWARRIQPEVRTELCCHFRFNPVSSPCKVSLLRPTEWHHCFGRSCTNSEHTQTAQRQNPYWCLTRKNVNFCRLGR